MPFISPNEAPLLVTHSLPLRPSVTYGMRSFRAAEALAVNRSGGSQIRSMWQSAEMTSYFIGMSSVRAFHQHDSRGDNARLKFPVQPRSERADATRTDEQASLRRDGNRFRPDLSGPLCQPLAGEGGRLRHQDRAAAR